jgi:hypothetical protein
MSLCVWLAVVGVVDLLRAARDATSTGRRTLLVVIGVALLVLAGLAGGLTAAWWWSVGLVWGAGLAAWVLTSSAALTAPADRRPRWRAAAFASFLAPLLVLLLVGDRPLPDTGAVTDLAENTLVGSIGGAVFMAYVAAALVQLSTGNVLVRLVLDAVGVPAAANEKQLRGGRLLGPMERLFLLLLTSVGQLGAGAVVVAAKGLLRWPELKRTSESGPTDVSEYFLIGSLASWLVALGGWLVVQLLG